MESTGGLLGFGSLIDGFKLFKQVIPIRKALSPSDQSFMNQFGGRPIVSMSVIRTPIQQYVNVALSAITLGKWKDAIRKYGFDKMFHLGLVGKLDDGTQFITQKNDTVRLRVYSETDVNSQTESRSVDLDDKNPTLQSLFDNAQRERGDQFWVYDAFSNNCQDFIIALLGSSGLLTQSLVDFIKQDVSRMVSDIDKRNPIASRIVRGVTDISSRLRRLVGRGLVPGDEDLPPKYFGVGKVPDEDKDEEDDAVQLVLAAFQKRYSPFMNAFEPTFLQELAGICVDIFRERDFTREAIKMEVTDVIEDTAGEAIPSNVAEEMIEFLTDIIFRESEEL